MKETQEKPTGLPENAFRPLKPGEKYEPLMSPGKTYPEVNFWSVTWGLVIAVIFSAAAAYLGLKVGQVFEAAIPIAIIAVGISSATKRKGALGENVMIQSIGACSGVIVAGAIFTLPALYILQEKYPEMTVNFMQMFISSLLGGVLGILFLIPFRKYFVKTSTANILSRKLRPVPRCSCRVKREATRPNRCSWPDWWAVFMTSSWEPSAGGTRTSQAASADGAKPLPTSSNWYSRLTRELPYWDSVTSSD